MALRDPRSARLLQYLTIPVSEMFRDSAGFLALREHRVPVLHTYPLIKAWVAGCSTGEEVYSMAILLKEEGLLERALIYATDINLQSLEKARQGIFRPRRCATTPPTTSAAEVVAPVLRLLHRPRTAAPDPALRANVIFADHSLATDSVFCRDVLRRAATCSSTLTAACRTGRRGLFHDSLCHRGILRAGQQGEHRLSAYERFDTVSRPDCI